jgi:hypothetical protein
MTGKLSSFIISSNTPPMYAQTGTPYELLDRPRKAVLIEEFIGKPINALRTPAMILDRKLFAENCARMHQKSKTWGASFRAHLKTHKVRYSIAVRQVNLISTDDRRDKTSAHFRRGSDPGSCGVDPYGSLGGGESRFRG